MSGQSSASCNSALLCSLLAASALACGPKATTNDVVTTVEGVDEGPRYQAGQDLGAPSEIDSSLPEAAYLSSVAARIQPAWASFLEDCRVRLPSSHALNNVALIAHIGISVSVEGQIKSIVLSSSSGQEEFDQVAQEIVAELSALAVPQSGWASDDGLVHLSWAFARDKRQAGAASAKIEFIELPLNQALPRLLARADIASAARRILESEIPAEQKILYLDTLLKEVVALALADPEPAVQRAGLLVAAAGDYKEFVAQSRSSLASTDVELAWHAIKALAVLGDASDTKALMRFTRGGANISTRLSARAATSLVALGQAVQVEEAALAGLNGKDAASRLASLAVLASIDSSASVSPLSKILAGPPKRARNERVAAAAALGRQAVNSPGAVKSLLAGADTSDAAVRVACVKAIGAMARTGTRSKLAYWKVLDLVRNKDERVRAAAIEAAAYLEPSRFGKELQSIRAGGSKLVVIGMAQVLGVIPGEVALSRLLDLASSKQVAMRKFAALGLIGHREDARAAAALTALLADEAAEVRLLALASVSTEEGLLPFADDVSIEIQARTLTRLAQLKSAGVMEMLLGKLAATDSSRATQTLWVDSWLQGK